MARLTGDAGPLVGTTASIMAAETFSPSSPDRDFEIADLPDGTSCDEVRNAVDAYFASRRKDERSPFITVSPYGEGFLVSVPALKSARKP